MRARPALALACTSTGAYAGLQVETRVFSRQFALRAGSAAAEIEALLDSAAVRPEQLGDLVVATGPGPHTATRNAVAAMQGLACALDRPLRGVRTDLAQAVQVGLDSGAPRALVAAPADGGDSWDFWLYDRGWPHLAEAVSWQPSRHRRVPLFALAETRQDAVALREQTGAEWVAAAPPDPTRALLVLAGAAAPLAPEEIRPSYAHGSGSYRKFGRTGDVGQARREER